MRESIDLWPEKGRSIWEIRDTSFELEIKWQKKPYDDYKRLALNYYDCGYALFVDIINSDHDNVKTDMWFLSAIYLMRQSLELGLKALHCRVQTRNPDIQKVFLDCGHNLALLFNEYLSKGENYLHPDEEKWLIEYFNSIELVDEKSDLFRFPFDDHFLSQYRDKFLDNVAVANNLLQAFALVKKCLNCGNVVPGDEFNSLFEPKFLILGDHGLGNCYLWKSFSDEGFYPMVTGYVDSADYLFYECNTISLPEKVYPIIFLLRNALELCLKRLFYAQVNKCVPKHVFNSKRKSHLLKKDLWTHVKPVIVYYSKSSSSDLELIDVVEKSLSEIDKLDKNGDNFRYPTSYSLEYRINNKNVDVKNMFECMHALVNFLDACDYMLEDVSDFEAEMYSYYSY